MSKRPPQIRNAAPGDVVRCFEIESVSYGPEGATCENIRKRIATYPQGFFVLTVNSKIVGFINSGCTNKNDLADEDLKSMIGHEAGGKNLVVFSVVVDPDHRGNKYAAMLIARFNRFADESHKNILLMCRKEHVAMYAKFGFKEIGESKSTHGGVKWFEMTREAAG